MTGRPGRPTHGTHSLSPDTGTGTGTRLGRYRKVDVVVVIGIVVRCQKLLEGAGALQVARDSIQGGEVAFTRVPESLREGLLHAELLAVHGDRVHIDRQAIRVQTQPPFAAHAVHVSSAVVHGTHSEFAQNGTDLHQGQGETTVHDQR